MKTSLFLGLIIFLSFPVIVFAQNVDADMPTCKQPFSSKFDEFEFTNLESAKERLDLFGLQLKNLNARAIVIGYGGKITEANQGRAIASEIETYLTDKFEITKYVTVSAWNGGHREKPFVELYLKPESCSSDPEKAPTLSGDEVTFKEEAEFFPTGVSRKNLGEMETLLVFKSDPFYPPAARAVRANGKVLLFVIVDEKENVIKTKAIDGHPLLRAVSEATVRTWKYQIQKEKNKPVKFGGKAIIDFDKIAEEFEIIQTNY